MANNLLDKCKPYMLNSENMDNFKISICIQETNNKSNKDNMSNKIQTTKIANDINLVREEGDFVTDKEDKLFWCFFVILKGFHEYEINGNFKTEKDLKIESIENLRKMKGELKALKLSLINIEDRLLNYKKIDIMTLVALALLYKKNIVYIWNRKYYEIINNIDEHINIIINDNRNIKLIIENSNKILDYYRDNYLRVENIDKPFKSITAYSKNELITIAEKLGLKNIDKKTSKKELYEKIKFDCV